MIKKTLTRIKIINILAIHSGHNAGIALIKNNKLAFAVSEEKFTNIKNQSGFPKLSIHYVLENYLKDVQAPKWKDGITWKNIPLKKINSRY